MIRYALSCDKGHGFESWFPDSSAFDGQVRRKLVACPVCNSTRISKAIMAPNIARKDRESGPDSDDSPQDTASLPVAAPVSAPSAPALLSEEALAVRAMLKAVHRHVVENADNVGKDFADEALKIHHGEADERPIYGQATPEDAQMLEEEGVPFNLLPMLPDEQN